MRLPVPAGDLRSELRARACSRRRSTSPACGSRGATASSSAAATIGLEKVEGLLACDGDVTLVAPEANDALQALADEGSITWEQRPYEAGTSRASSWRSPRPTTPTSTSRSTTTPSAGRCSCNVVDVPSLCNFILPAIVRTGPLAIAISTAGASPALAKRIKRGDRRVLRRALRAAGRDPQRRPRLGEGQRCPPTRTARPSSRGSSTATPTRSSWSARAATATSSR